MNLFKRLFHKLFCLILCFLFITCQNNSASSQFDKNKAFAYLEKQCEIGPRFPGSENHVKARDFLVEELEKYTDKVKVQSFSAINYLENKRALGYNIIASFGKGPPQLLLCAHWDSRPQADQDPIETNQQKPILGANDGASGVAILLEVARNLKFKSPSFPVDIVLFDAEDMGRESHTNEFCQGSTFFAKNLSFNYKPKAGILLDLVGDSDLQIYIEENSQEYASDLVDQVWDIAEQLNFPEFIREERYYITDDHLPLINAGIPTIDIIDFDYDHWHTIEDTPDKCSPESLEKVGQVLLTYIYNQSQD